MPEFDLNTKLFALCVDVQDTSYQLRIFPYAVSDVSIQSYDEMPHGNNGTESYVRISSYCSVNTLRLSYTNQSVNVVQ
jgi:hypothetical protein